jgi:hypothetical protein
VLDLAAARVLTLYMDREDPTLIPLVEHRDHGDSVATEAQETRWFQITLGDLGRERMLCWRAAACPIVLTLCVLG